MSDIVIVGIIAAVASLVGIVFTGWVNIRLGKIHKQMNSRMDELIATTKREATLVGNKEGRKELKDEQKKK